MGVPRGCRVGIYVYCRGLSGLGGVGLGICCTFCRILDDSAAKSGVCRGGGGCGSRWWAACGKHV